MFEVLDVLVPSSAVSDAIKKKKTEHSIISLISTRVTAFSCYTESYNCILIQKKCVYERQVIEMHSGECLYLFV